MPAAAVIPALVAYTKIAAVKTLVVGVLGVGCTRRGRRAVCRQLATTIYCEKIMVLKAIIECISME